MRVLRNLLMFLAVLLCPTSGVRAFDPLPSPSEQSEDAARQAEALLSLSERQNSEDHAIALQTARQALALWQLTPDRAGLARTYAHIGRCYFAQSELPAAIQNYEMALQLWRDLDQPAEEADTLIMLSFIDARRGEWASSIAFLNHAQSLIEEKDEPRRMGQIVSGLAYIFNEVGLPENGLDHYRGALKHYQRTPEARDDILTIQQLGSTFHLLRNHAEALNHLQQALASVEPGSIDAAFCHHYLGRVYAEIGEHPAALHHLRSALPIYSNAGNPKEAAQVRALLGQVYEQQGQIERARRNYRQALATFVTLSDRINQAAVYYALGRLELKQGNDNAAEDYLRQSVDVTENIRRVPTSSDLTAAFSANVYERYSMYIECLMRQHDKQPERGLATRAFQLSELARARALSELLSATQTNLVPGLDPHLADQEKSLRQTLRAKGDYKVTLLAKKEYSRAELAELHNELARLEVEYQEVTATIRSRYPAFEQVVRPVAWDLPRIQEQVIADDQTVLLEYSLGVDRSYVWAITRNDIRSYELPAQADIEAAARRVYKELVTPPANNTADDLTSATHELGRMILWPVAAELDKRRVIVVADGVLHYVPFQVLPQSQLNSEPLVANHEIINTPSASILGELRQEAERRQPARKVLAAFGNPVFQSTYTLCKSPGNVARPPAVQPLVKERWRNAVRDIELSGDSFDPADIRPLFYAKQELANLRDVATGGEVFVAEECDATRGRLIGTDLTQYAILHIATHGLLNSKRPENSALVLATVDSEGRAQDGFVWLQDIYSLRAPVNLVVLSACRTGLGKDVRGEGLLGLTRGFMYAGASSVVASLWNVDDEATAELMKQFYINLLRKGMPPAEALRAAQNSLRENPQWRSPYYWAAFTLQGEYRQVIKYTPAAGPTTFYSKVMMGGMLLMLLTGVAWWYRRRRLRTMK